MDEGFVGFLVFLSISVAVSLVTHVVIRRYWLASVVSAVIASVSFAVAVFLHQGSTDPLMAIAFLGAWVYALLISFVVGWVFGLIRKNSKP